MNDEESFKALEKARDILASNEDVTQFGYGYVFFPKSWFRINKEWTQSILERAKTDTSWHPVWFEINVKTGETIIYIANEKGKLERI